ncbi:hypothetical protein pb186bvf_004862 [Paramecium bursaria]
MCQVKGHENKEVTRVCTFRVCYCKQRWACDLCVEEQIHLHKNSSLPYLIEISTYQDYLKQIQPVRITKLKNQLLAAQKLVDEIQLVNDSIQEMIYCQQRHQQFLNNDENILSLDNQSLDGEILLGTAFRTYNNIDNHILSSQIQLQNLKYKDLQYDIVPIQESISQVMERPKISGNEKQLGFIRDVKDLLETQNFNLMSMHSNKCFYGKYIKTSNGEILFSNDSTFVIVLGENYIYVFLSKGLKLIFKKEITLQIYKYKWIKEDQFMTLDQDGIKIYKILKKKQVQQIVKNNLNIAFDFDSYNNLIIASEENRIYFYSRKPIEPKENRKTRELSLFREYQIDRHAILEILISNNGERLVLSHIANFSIWQIDHSRRQLQLRSQYLHCHLQLQRVNFDWMILTERESIAITDDKFNLKYMLCIQSELVAGSKNFLIVELIRGNKIILKNQIKNK